MGPGEHSRIPRQGYGRRARHLDLDRLPPLLQKHLPAGPLALADVGCGDGPLFGVLERGGFISDARPVYAIDLDRERLDRVARRFPYIAPVEAPADRMTAVPDHSLDFVTAMMVIEHVPDQNGFLDEIHRVLKPGGILYLTTVFKRSWAWYFRRRNGESVLDVSHLREYTDVEAFISLLALGRRFARLEEFALEPLWFPLVDPVLFLLAGRIGDALLEKLRPLRAMKVPIPGYYSMTVVLAA